MFLEANDLGFFYPGNGSRKWIFRGLSIQLKAGTVTVLGGDSGAGKSTLAKVLARYEKQVSGNVLLDGRSIAAKGYRAVQLIFQHPEKAVNPRFTMKDILYEGWPVDDALAERLGIEHEWLSRYPAELSGGELQRFCIARALGPATRFIIADEISAMFDPVTQAQIWELLLAESARRDIGILAITHDSALAKRLSSRILYMDDLCQGNC